MDFFFFFLISYEIYKYRYKYNPPDYPKSSNRHGTPNHILNTLTVVKFITKFVAIRLIKLEN